MKEEERELYKRKAQICDRLGAKYFQKLVFQAEKIKYKVLKHFPSYVKLYDKYCDRIEKRELKKAKTDTEREDAKRKNALSKMMLRKELQQEQNVNYHMNKNRPCEIYEYLKWNKSVHIRGLKKDGILAAMCIAGMILNIPLAMPILVLTAINGLIDFECVNIQNRNIYKYKISEKVLQKRHKKKISENIDNYGDVAEMIDEKIVTSDKKPSLSEMIADCKTPDQARKLRDLVIRELKSRNKLDRGEYSYGKGQL